MSANAIDYICKRIKNSDSFETIYVKLLRNISESLFNESSVNSLGQDEYSRLLRYSDFISNSNNEEDRNLALKIISSIYHFYRDDYSCQLITKSILNKLGLFSAEESFVDEGVTLPFSSDLYSEFHKIRNKIKNTSYIFTNSQYNIYNKIMESDYFSFSGPTSLGKSFLIKHIAIELISVNNIIVFILPTKALLEEYLIDIKTILNDRKIENINVSKSVSRINKNSKNILVFTQERYNAFLYDSTYADLKVDFLFVDEAHKVLDRKNNRAITLYKVIRRSIDSFKNMRVVFSCPVISNPRVFFNVFNINETDRVNSLCVKESPVNQDLYFINSINRDYRYYDSISNKKINFDIYNDFCNDYDIINKLSKKSMSNIIYVSSKTECIRKCNEFFLYLNNNNMIAETKDEELLLESKLIKEYIHNEFKLSELIKYGIAYHHGSLPLFIRKRIEDLYARKKIVYIFCTSTLLEGVNLPTKNVFIYPFPKRVANDEKKCKLDFWNLAGRAGRYRSELTGNIICINSSDNNWDNVEDKINKDKGIDINDEISNILSKHIKILNYFNGKVKEPDANIIQVGSLILSEVITYLENGTIGSILERYDVSIREKLIISGANHLRKNNIITMDKVAFSENHIFPTRIHAKAQRYAEDSKNILVSCERDDVFKYLKIINDIYLLRGSDDSLNQLCIVAYSWLRGNTLSQLISNSIKYSTTVRDPVSYRWIDFNRNDSEHLNAKILEVINCIESEVTFKLEMCISHFYQLCKSIHGEGECGINLSSYLEYGTLDNNIIELQDLGFSRLAAIEIFTKYRDCLILRKNNTSITLNVVLLKGKIEKHGVIDRELSWLKM